MQRRDFIKGAAGLSGGMFIANALPGTALATGSSYKALVCVMLLGGHDGADLFVPMDSADNAKLKSMRPGIFADHAKAGNPRTPNGLVELDVREATGGRRFGVPSQLAALKDLYDSREMAIVGSVGPLVRPLTRQSYDASPTQRPARLFSHNDQQSTWMTLALEGQSLGWGGAFLDSLGGGQLGPFAAINGDAMNDFLTGASITPFGINGGSAMPRRAGARMKDRAFTQANVSDRETYEDIINRHMKFDGLDDGNLFLRDYAALSRDGVGRVSRYVFARKRAQTLSTRFPASPLGRKLRAVAETIAARGPIGATRQIIGVSQGGFDTHHDQAAKLAELQIGVVEALSAFRDAMIELGLWNDVAVFTASDFGRTLVENGSGTDHGWGNHHMVMGGNVRGGRLYGSLPDLDPDGEDYIEGRGRLLPRVSVEQYAATLGRWLGVSNGALLKSLPNLGRFDTADLGFMA